MPTFVSTFAGIGGFDLGLERAGFECAGQVELDVFCRRVLERRWPGVRRADDVRAVAHPQRDGRRGSLDRAEAGECPDGRAVEWDRGTHVDLLTGGFPCQDLSVAGKRAGLAGERSGLFYEYVRIAKALRPTFGLVENVPGLLSSHRGRDFWLVLEGLRECWPVVGWRVVDSQYFGVPQRRRRVFIVGGPSESSVAEILALTEGGGGDLAAGGEAGTRVAATLSAGAHRPGVNDPGRRNEDDVNLIAFDPTTSLDQAPNDRTSPPLKVGTGLASMPWAPAVLTCLDGSPYADREAEHTRLVQGASAIRRLTPLECERLQGFPDGWTCLCQPLEAYATDPDGAALACTCPDSPRYRALGNAVTVNVIEWLGRRLLAVMDANP